MARVCSDDTPETARLTWETQQRGAHCLQAGACMYAGLNSAGGGCCDVCTFDWVAGSCCRRRWAGGAAQCSSVLRSRALNSPPLRYVFGAAARESHAARNCSPTCLGCGTWPASCRGGGRAPRGGAQHQGGCEDPCPDPTRQTQMFVACFMFRT